MTNKKSELTFTQIVDASPEDVYYTFATGQGWRNWLCDSARFEARAGGSFQLAWASGRYSAGTVVECKRPEKVTLTWRGKDYPGPTSVEVELKGENGVTSVTILHRGFGQGKKWEPILNSAHKEWEKGLENLVSIFSTGEDLRVVRRPMLGIFLSDFDEDIAKELGVPVTKGVRIDQPVGGMGAERAGLQPSDIIVGMDGKSILGFDDLGEALRVHQAGDIVKVDVYRGSERISVDMELSRRPIEKFELDPVTMANKLREIDAEVIKELEKFFDGVTETEAEFSPSPGEWSAKETMAHLILSEQFAQTNISELICDGQREFNDEIGNVNAHHTAVLKVSPTIPELINRLKDGKEETATLLELAKELKARKGVMWTFSVNNLQFPGFHERTHMDQMRAAIESAREG
jgi:uncharacterized protein YndB with AHSA1/START domain